MMIKKTAFTLLILIFFLPLFSLEVARDELRSVTETIEFINYTGPHTVIQSVDEIRGIGLRLATAVNKNNLMAPGTSGSQNLYYVIHAVDPNTKEKLDADILIIGENAQVDHVQNLRRILSSYLSSAYNYSRQDADTLAHFITIYNAVYRSKMDVFNAKYKALVTGYLQQEKVGLSVNYVDWPGKTQIVIPLLDLSGGLSTVDTTIISDKSVVDSMREADGKEIDVRKDMVDLKEREADAAREEAQSSQKEAVRAEEKAKEALAEQKQEEQKLAEKKEEAAKAVEIAKEKPEDVQAQKAAEDAEKEVVAQEQKLAEAKEKTEEAKQEAEELKTIAKEEQVIADRKTAEAQQDRLDIAKDQKEVMAAEDARSQMTTSYALKVIDTKALLSALVLIDVADGAVVKESPVNVIRNRQVIKTNEGYLAVAGKPGKNTTIKLVILDPKNLEIQKESAEIVHESSAFAFTPNAVFVVIVQDKKTYLAAYNYDLSLSARSEVEVQEVSPIIITDRGISVIKADGNPILLDAKTLKKQ